jgi:hypothetical protein
MTLDLTRLRDNPDLVRLNPGLLAEPAEKPSKGAKYGNVRTTFQGREYASKREAQRAQELDLMEKAGEIAGWLPQWPFRLAGGIKYVCDFLVILPDGTWRAEDVKSEATRRIAAYRMKRRLYQERFNADIAEVD